MHGAAADFAAGAHDRARDAHQSHRQQREADGHFLAGADRHALRLGDVAGAGVIGRGVARGVGRRFERVGAQRGADVVVAGREAIEAERAGVVGFVVRADVDQPAVPLEHLAALDPDAHVGHRIAEVVLHAAVDHPAAEQREVRAVHALPVGELDRRHGFERPALAEPLGDVARLGRRERPLAGGQIAQLEAAVGVGGCDAPAGHAADVGAHLRPADRCPGVRGDKAADDRSSGREPPGRGRTGRAAAPAGPAHPVPAWPPSACRWRPGAAAALAEQRRAGQSGDAQEQNGGPRAPGGVTT